MGDRDYLAAMIQRSVNGCSSYWSGLIAEYLIAHGVVVREKGEWKQKKHKIFGNSYDYVCPVCGCDYALAEYNFCPHCGSDMRRGENG